MEYAEGWVTSGWKKFEDIGWVELGSVPGVTAGEGHPPDLTIHQVADKLNELERLKEQSNG